MNATPAPAAAPEVRVREASVTTEAIARAKFPDELNATSIEGLAHVQFTFTADEQIRVELLVNLSLREPDGSPTQGTCRASMTMAPQLLPLLAHAFAAAFARSTDKQLLNVIDTPFEPAPMRTRTTPAKQDFIL